MNTSPLILLVCVALIGCEQQSPRGSSPTSRATANANRNTTARPVGVGFQIIEETTTRDTKRSLTVRLDEKITEEQLATLAQHLMEMDRGPYERTFIVHLLPGMEVGAGAWATTHFNPELEVRILGMTIEEENQARSDSTMDDRDVIGTWLDDSPYVGSRITIFEHEGALFIEHLYKGSSKPIEKEIIRIQPSDRERYEPKDESPDGDHYIIDANGDLEIRDSQGLINTAARM